MQMDLLYILWLCHMQMSEIYTFYLQNSIGFICIKHTCTVIKYYKVQKNCKKKDGGT